MPNPSTVLSGLIAQNAMSKLSLSACFRIMSALSGVICVCVCVCVCVYPICIKVLFYVSSL